MSAPRPRSVALRAGGDGAHARLRHAVALARANRLASARRHATSAITEAPDDPVALVVAAMVLFVTRDHHVALDLLERAAVRGAGARAHWLRYERAERLGWDREAIQALDEGAAAEPNDPRWPAKLTELHALRRAWGPAARHAARWAELAPDAPEPWSALARAHAARGDVRAASAALDRATALDRSGASHLEAAALLRRAGELGGARAAFREALAIRPDDPAALIGLAELALWSADHRTAAALAERAIEIGPSAAAERILGTIAWLAGDRARAVARLDAALAVDRRDPDAHAWLAEIALRDGRLDDAQAHLASAIESAGGTLFAGYVLRLRRKIETDIPAADALPAHMVAHHRAPLAAICPELAAVLDGHDRDAWRVLLDHALERMHGNRSPVPTFLAGGELRPVPDARDPRARSRAILERIRVEDGDSLLAELEALAAEHPDSSLPLAHRGELLLWLGRHEEARAVLEQAIAKVAPTRWAYIGLTALDLVAGEHEAALVTTERGLRAMHGSVGPAVHVHRGEALLRLGRLDDAEADLERAVELGPTRVSAWIDLALLRAARGETDRLYEAAAAAIELAPGLASDAARELGVELFGDGGAPPDAGTLARVLEKALAMLGGNRASTVVTYRTRDGRLRFGRHAPRGTPPVHARDKDELGRAASVLERGLAGLDERRPGPRPRDEGGGSSAPAEAVLSRADVEHFVEHGWVRVERCFSADAVARWRASVRARVIADPRRWVEVDPTRASGPVPDPIDFDDPQAWPTDSIVVRGARRWTIAEEAPRLWAAIRELLPEGAVRTTGLNDHVVLRTPWVGVLPPPELRRRGWHVDNPSEQASLEGLTNGLVGLVLLSDVAPAGGATWIAPSSVPRLAGMLAERGPLDLVDRAVGEELGESERAPVECTGAAGDVYLTHPLMVHCGSINEGRAMRWLSNPNIELTRPLDPRGSSPVERALARALDLLGPLRVSG